MPVFASDMLSSVAYAPDEILLALSLSGIVALTVSPWIGLAVAVVILVIVLCYRLNLQAYPSGGGDYEVAGTNLGTRAGLVVAASLLVDFVLTLAVSLTVFASYIGAMFPDLKPYRVLIAVIGIGLVTLAGLRGSWATRGLLAVPTYLFVGAVLLTLAVGFIRVLSGDTPEAVTSDFLALPGSDEETLLTGFAAVFIVLRAFSSGSVALAGVQTVATAVPLFRPPRGRNAAGTLLVTGLLSAIMLVGITWLSAVIGIKFVARPEEQLVTGSGSPVGDFDQDPVLGQLAQAVFSGFPFMFYVVAAVAALVLLVAANTAVEGFPGLASRLARDGFLPRQLASRGDRMTFSNGILLLAAAAIVLVVATQARVPDLIELYLVGVFLAFVLGQAGMIRHWTVRIRTLVTSPLRRRMQLNRLVGWLGLLLTGLVLVVVLSTKFFAGAWIAVAAIAILYVAMGLVRRHYSRVDAELTPEADDDSARTLPSNTHAVVVVTAIHKPTLRALAYARASRPTFVNAITVAVDEDGAQRLQERWDAMGLPVRLTILDSPYRDLNGPVMDYITGIRKRTPRDLVIVYLPQYIVGRWWENLLHNQTSLRLKTQLLNVPNVVVASVPWRLSSFHRARDQRNRRVGPSGSKPTEH
ncbi:APC family permease [Brevibacterium daeguense]|uniref:APC family permease n=1 Tax=Brevibacterium daeguense TaxID=909936 RepID=A0ABP8EMX2_9MICO|nr:APC family permease [Brevibacterium daeguense]